MSMKRCCSATSFTLSPWRIGCIGIWWSVHRCFTYGGIITVPLISIDFLCHCDSFCEANTGHCRSIRFHRTRCWESSCHMGIRMHPCVPFAHGQWSVASAWIHLWEPEFPFQLLQLFQHVPNPFPLRGIHPSSGAQHSEYIAVPWWCTLMYHVRLLRAIGRLRNSFCPQPFAPFALLSPHERESQKRAR